MRYTGVTLRRHVAAHVEDLSLRQLIFEIATCARYINVAIKDAERGMAGTQNKYGESQLQLDVLADNILEDRFRTSFLVKEFASEEGEDLVTFSHLQGKYSVTVDPLDGSSLVDVNLSIGTIIGIHRSDHITEPNSLVAAMYITYGPLTTLVYSAVEQGVHEFVLNPAGEFVLAKEDIQLKERGKIYSPGGLEIEWTEPHRKYMDFLRHQGYKLRYSGGMVGDCNQILIKGGGVFTYPDLTTAPTGKLRLLFEAQPFAYLFEQAGGAATDGVRRILDIHPTSVDQRTPLYIGSTYEVETATKFLTGEGL